MGNQLFIELAKESELAHTSVGESSIYLGLFFIVLGLAIKHLKLYFLIAGYNTMPKEEKEKVAISKIATLMRNVFVAMGIILIIGNFISAHFENPKISQFIFYPTLGVGLIFLLTQSNSNKYKK